MSLLYTAADEHELVKSRAIFAIVCVIILQKEIRANFESVHPGYRSFTPKTRGLNISDSLVCVWNGLQTIVFRTL